MVQLLLLVQSAPQLDTVVTVAARDGYDLVLVIAAIAVTLTAAAALLSGILALFAAREVGRSIERLKQQIETEPTLAGIRKIVENSEVISDILRTESGKLSGSISRLTDKVDHASGRIEERIDDLNALVEVVQEEVEGSFIKSAAVAKGFRAGIGRLIRKRDVSGSTPPDDDF